MQEQRMEPWNLVEDYSYVHMMNNQLCLEKNKAGGIRYVGTPDNNNHRIFSSFVVLHNYYNL